MNLLRSDGALVRHLATTDEARINALKLETPEFITFKAADGVTDLNGMLFKPAGFDPAKKYPLIVFVYGGPTDQLVRNVNQTGSYNQALAQLGYVVWVADNRGTPNRGKAFAISSYMKLGQIDIEDQAEGVRALEQQKPFVDSSRVGIHGTSYGGYMTVLALLKYPDLFQVGVDGWGNSDWRSYDTIYTERYMRTPQENPQGYEAASNVSKVANLQGHLFMAFGECDNNVHIGNTMALTDALLKANKHFEMMVYPGMRHGVSGVDREDFLRREREYFATYLHPGSTGK